MIIETRSSKRVSRFLIVAFATSLLLQLTAAAQVKLSRRVLILNEVGTSYPLINLVDEGIRTALAKSSYRIEFYREYMETVLFSDPADQQRLRDFYVRKYQNRRPDVIITVGSSPLRFMAERHRKDFPRIPIVFCFPNAPPDSLTLPSDFAGVNGDVAPAATVAAALRLLPDTLHVVVVGGVAPYDRRQQAVVKKQLMMYQGRIDISYLTDLPASSLLERLKHLPSHTVVLLTALGKDANGAIFTANDFGPMVVGAANAPVFSLVDTLLNHGEVGGNISSAIEQGRVAGDIAVRMLNGEKPEDIGTLEAGPRYMFDARALRRWGLKEKDLPPGSTVFNRELSFWEAYKQYVIAGFLACLLQSVAIVALLWQRAQRKKAQTELQKSKERLQLAQQVARIGTFERNLETGVITWTPEMQEIHGLSPGGFRGTHQDFIDLIHPNDRAGVMELRDRSLQTRQPAQGEWRIIWPDGSVRWIAARWQVFIDESGKPLRILGVNIDITERKVAEEALASVSLRLIQAQEQERARIARELHDNINQRLSTLGIDLDKLGQHPPDSRTELKNSVDGLALRLSEISAEVQVISHRLHSSKLEYLGLAAACKGFCREVAERQNLSIEFKADDVPSAVPQEPSLALFRVLQESLQNASKHARAQHCEVALRGMASELQLTVRDDGIGFDVEAAANRNGLGLISMKERVASLGGTIAITSKPGAGTEIRVRVPMQVTNRMDQTSHVA